MILKIDFITEVIKIRGIIISYKPFDNSSRVTLHHILFGRLTYRNYRGKKYSYYVQGMLDKTPFIRVVDGKIFVLDMENINLEELRIFGDITTEECEREITINSLKTGEEYWYDVAKERGLDFYVRKHKSKRT